MARRLAELAQAAAARLASHRGLHVSYGGGVFKSRLFLERFRRSVGKMSALAGVVEPRFEPHVGALILAFQAAGTGISAETLSNMAASRCRVM